MASILKVNTIQDATNSNTALSIDSSGRITTPTRPSFLAHGANLTSSNSTGYLPYPNITTTRGGHNIGGHYNTSTYVFTAPFDGVYVFSFSLYAYATNSVDIYGAINNDTSRLTAGFQVNAGSNDDNYPTVSGSVTLQLSASETFGFYNNGGTYHTNTSGSYFCGHLLG